MPLSGHCLRGGAGLEVPLTKEALMRRGALSGGHLSVPLEGPYRRSRLD